MTLWEWICVKQPEYRDQGKYLLIIPENGKRYVVEAVGPNFILARGHGRDITVTRMQIEKRYTIANFKRIAPEKLDTAEMPEDCAAAIDAVKAKNDVTELRTGGYIEASVKD